MPRTRSQAAVSPLVSLEAPRRTRKVASSSTTASSSQEGVATKLKRARKPKAVTPASTEEPVNERRPSMDTSEDPTLATPQEPKDEAPTPAPFFMPANMDEDGDDETFSTSNYSAPSPSKRSSFKRTFATVKSALKKPTESLRQRFNNLRRSPPPSNDFEEKMVTFRPTPTTKYSLSESQILDAAAEILLSRMESDTFDRPGPLSSSIRCPCCRDSLACPRGHDLSSWVPNDITGNLNALLTTIFAEGICTSSEVKEEALRNEQRRKTQERQRSQEQLEKLETTKPNGQNQPKPQPKLKSSKHARSNDDENAGPDGEPASQRPRLGPKPTPTPRKRRTTTPRQKLTNAQLRQRAIDWESGKRPPSIFRLDETVAQREAEEKEAAAARKAAEETAENERLEAITRAAMERHAVLGEVPENMGNSLEIPIYNDPEEPVDTLQDTPYDPEAAEAPETPGSRWGFQIRNLFGTVGHSMSRFVPRFRTVTDQAVPFVAGGGATPAAITNAVADGASSTPVHPGETEPAAQGETAENDQDAMDLTYSLYPPKLKLPSTPAPNVQSEHVAAQPVDETVPQPSSTGTETPTNSATMAAAATTSHEPPANQSSHLAEVSGNEQNGKSHDTPEKAPKKRKRAPSPDVIPNPPGCSYGLDLDYFGFSSEDEDEDESEQAEPSLATTKPPEKRVRIESPPRSTTTPQAPVPTAARTETQSTSPYIPPGWNRPTTTVYNGTLFRSRTPNPHTPGRPQTQGGFPCMDSPRVPSPQPSTGSLLDIREHHRRTQIYRAMQRTNANVNNALGRPNTPQFAPSPARTAPFSFGRPSVSEQAASSNARPSNNVFAQPPSVAMQPSSFTRPRLSATPRPQQPRPSAVASTEPPAIASPRPSAGTSSQPSAGASSQTSAGVTSQRPAVASPQPSVDVSSQPSDVPSSQTSAFASSQPSGIVPAASITTGETSEESKNETEANGVSPFDNIEKLPPNTDATEMHRPKSPSKLRHRTFSSSPIQEAQQHDEDDLRQVFGEDEAGRQAYDLFQSCPSGDLSQLSWPEFTPLPDDDIQEMVNATDYTQGHEEEIRQSFQQSFENFQRELHEGLVDTDELLEGLPI